MPSRGALSASKPIFLQRAELSHLSTAIESELFYTDLGKHSVLSHGAGRIPPPTPRRPCLYVCVGVQGPGLWPRAGSLGLKGAERGRTETNGEIKGQKYMKLPASVLLSVGMLIAVAFPAFAMGKFPNGYHGAPGPIVGAGLPMLALGYAAHWLLRRYRRTRQ